MKKLTLIIFIVIVIAILGFVMTSCSTGGSSIMNEEKNLSNMTCPIIVIAKAPETDWKYGCITIGDSMGNIQSYTTKINLGYTLYSTYEVGDTLLNCK